MPLIPFYNWIDIYYKITRAAKMFKYGIIKYLVKLGYKNNINKVNMLAFYTRDISILHIKAYIYTKHFPTAPLLNKLVI